MRHEDLQKSSVKHYSLEVGMRDHYDPFAGFRDDVGERVFQTYVPWEGGQPMMVTPLPEVRYLYEYDVIYTRPNDEKVVVAKGWFGISDENPHLQEALYTPAYYGDDLDYMQRASTFILPVGSTVRGIELVKDVVYNLGRDNRFRMLRPGTTESAQRVEKDMRSCYSGYRNCLHILVRYRTRDGDDRMVTLKRPEHGEFTMPTRPYDYWEKQAEAREYIDVGNGHPSLELLKYLSDPQLLD